MAQITIKEMLDAGVHFGHQTQRWNPEMKPFVYTNRGGIHIIDLQKSVVYARKAAEYVKDMASKGGRLMFVGTKNQASSIVKEAAEGCGQFYITKRWLGGILTNFATIKTSIDRLKKIDRMREKGELDHFSKKERANIEKEYTKLNEFLEGIREMKESPAAIFIIDVNKEHIAVAEAKKLGIKVIGVVDTNANPNPIDYPLPGNDDAIRSISLFANLIADSYKEGSKEWETKKTAVAKEEAGQAPRKEVAAKSGKNDQDGPTIVKRTTSGRKLVAAGMADDVEIELELNDSEKKKSDSESNSDQ